MPKRLALVMLGGGAGTAARYGVALWAERSLASAGVAPYGTLIVNVVGCFAIGALMQLGAAKRISPNALLALTTGFMGGFTTYSAYAWETVHAIDQGAVAMAIAYVVATVLLCIGAGVIGHELTARFASASS